MSFPLFLESFWSMSMRSDSGAILVDIVVINSYFRRQTNFTKNILEMNCLINFGYCKFLCKIFQTAHLVLFVHREAITKQEKCL